ncbi:MAG: DoxX family protein [Bacteroidetes bacterium]|nr:MAG: DoxX family protein [Bacteroidota bacterium]
MKSKILFGVSLLFGLMMINSGFNKFFNYMPMPEVPEAAGQFMYAIIQSGWLFTLVAIVEIIGGALFICTKTRALGAIVLLPIIVGILLFNIVMAPAGVILAVILFAINIWVIIENYDKYLPMVLANK